MKLRIAGLINDSVVDGEGYRLTIFTQGCKHNCKGCHNPQSHDLNGGKLISVNEILEQVKSNSLLSGVTFSGGEPFLQPIPLIKLAKKIHELNLTVWCYTGYSYEELLKMNNKNINELLDNIDVLVDGKFILEEKDLTLNFRGSKNQRILNIKNIRFKK